MKKAALSIVYSLTRLTGWRRLALLAGIALLTFSCGTKNGKKTTESDSTVSDSAYDTCYKSVQPMNNETDSMK